MCVQCLHECEAAELTRGCQSTLINGSNCTVSRAADCLNHASAGPRTNSLYTRTAAVTSDYCAQVVCYRSALPTYNTQACIRALSRTRPDTISDDIRSLSTVRPAYSLSKFHTPVCFWLYSISVFVMYQKWCGGTG